MPYIQISAVISSDNAEAVSDALTAEAALAITLDSASDDEVFQIFDEQPLWKKTKIHALFADDWPIAATVSSLRQQFPTLEWLTTKIADENWVHKTQANFPAQQFANNLWVLPSWEDSSKFSGNKIRIDPGLAFGTGTHPTTKLCLEFLANNPPQQKTVIDYGCGSGILALAALALDATKVDAIDHDAQALEATNNNAALNKFANNSLQVHHDHGQNIQPADLVIANILAAPLKQLAPRIISLCKHDLILSGILKTEAQTIIDIYAQDIKFIKQYSSDEWVLLHFQVTS